MPRSLVGMMTALALLVVGCGGDNEKGGSGSSGDWKAEVNAICKKNEEQIQDVATEVASSGQGDPRKAAAELLERSVEIEEDLIAELRDVSVPGDVQSGYTAFLDRIDDTLPLFGDLADVLRDGKEDPALTKELESIAADTRPFAEEHDLDACFSDAAPAS